MTAGEALRSRINSTLRQVGDDTGRQLEFTPLECWLIDQACAVEEQKVRVQARLDAELSGNARPASVNGLSAEVRRCVITIADLMSRIDFGTPAVAPKRKQRGRPGTAAVSWAG